LVVLGLHCLAFMIKLAGWAANFRRGLVRRLRRTVTLLWAPDHGWYSDGRNEQGALAVIASTPGVVWVVADGLQRGWRELL
jgi:hypothetical protein